MSNTKQHAEDIAQWCESRVQLDNPLNIHLTGCPNSCAQHYIGDIGLVGAKVQVSDEGDTVDGYTFIVGGGFGPDAACRPRNLPRRQSGRCAKTVERMLKAYLANRSAADESFLAFTRRHDIEALKTMFEREAAG